MNFAGRLRDAWVTKPSPSIEAPWGWIWEDVLQHGKGSWPTKAVDKFDRIRQMSAAGYEIFEVKDDGNKGEMIAIATLTEDALTITIKPHAARMLPHQRPQMLGYEKTPADEDDN